MSLCLGSLLPPLPLQEAMKASDGSLLGDPGRIPLSKREGIKWQRPRFTRQALMRCCLIKWILSSAAPQGSGRTRVTGVQRRSHWALSFLRSQRPSWTTLPSTLLGNLSPLIPTLPSLMPVPHRNPSSSTGRECRTRRQQTGTICRF